jgi:hypothetical protein
LISDYYSRDKTIVYNNIKLAYAFLNFVESGKSSIQRHLIGAPNWEDSNDRTHRIDRQRA